MQRILATSVVLVAVGVLLAAPVPAETRKPAAFPAGRYVLTGAGEPAAGDDVYEFTKSFKLKIGQYVLSGGPKPTDLILVDDDMEVHQDGKKLFVDDDHIASTDRRGKKPATYQGQPIVLVLDPAKKVRVLAVDHCATDAILGELWLHRWDGARKKLTEGTRQQSAPNLPNTFFDEAYALGEGFEMPEKVSTDAEINVPDKPATLLPRFRPANPAPVVQPIAANPPKPIDADEFIRAAITNGLLEDGVPAVLAGDLGKRDDFIGKCRLCQPAQFAFREHGKLKTVPAAKEGRGLSEEFAKRLKSDDNDTRRMALRELVHQYIDREYARRDLATEQKTALQTSLEEMRKAQADGLPAGRKFCPSCDGACRLAPKL
jgi:hypothetical protein